MNHRWLGGVLLALSVLTGTAWAQGVGHETLKLDAPKPQLLPTPPMGWNSWNKFACNVSEKLLREQAEAHGQDIVFAVFDQHLTALDAFSGFPETYEFFSGIQEIGLAFIDPGTDHMVVDRK